MPLVAGTWGLPGLLANAEYGTLGLLLRELERKNASDKEALEKLRVRFKSLKQAPQ